MTTYVVLGCRVLLGAVFLASAASKLRTRGAFNRFASSVERFGLVPPAWVRVVAAAVVAAESAVPVLLLVHVTAPAGFTVALGLLIGFTVVIGLALRRGVQAPCQCFGVSASPIGRRHLVRNLLLGAVAVAGLTAVLAGSTGAVHPGGIAVAGVTGLVLAGLTVVADDLVDLFTSSTSAGATKGAG